MLTIEDLRNPDRKSGFDYVASANPSSKQKRTRDYFCARHGTRPTKKGQVTDSWRGPTRHTAEEAAQDFCDYVNGQFVKPALEQWETPEIDMGNGDKRHAPKSEPVKVIREKFTGPHDLYDVDFLAPGTKQFVVRKVGITARGHSRYADIAKMLGLSIRPRSKAITYDTEAKAKKHENDLIDKLCADKKWKRVGKESFIPVSMVK